MADPVLIAITPELSTLRASRNPTDQSLAEYIISAFQEIDKIDRSRGAYDFAGSTCIKISLWLWRLAEKKDRTSLYAMVLMRISYAILERVASSPDAPNLAYPAA